MSRVLVIGDVMLDEYVHGVVRRMSPEAPVPVFEEQRREYRLGGAANVAAGVMALGCDTTLIGHVGTDAAGGRVHERLAHCGGRMHYSLPYDDDFPSRPTTVKTRYVVDGKQIFRSDKEHVDDISATRVDDVLWSTPHGRIIVELGSSDHLVCVLSDYAKGFLTYDLCRSVIKRTEIRGTKVIVDPKRVDWERYRDAWLITPNEREIRRTFAHEFPESTVDAVEPVGVRMLMNKFSIANCLVTAGSSGMTLHAGDDSVRRIPAIKHDIVDVTGAGDTVVAVIAARVASGAALFDAVAHASEAAGLAVQRQGTCVVSSEDMGW